MNREKTQAKKFKTNENDVWNAFGSAQKCSIRGNLIFFSLKSLINSVRAVRSVQWNCI